MSFDMRETARRNFLLSRMACFGFLRHHATRSLWNEKRQDRSTEISIAFAMVALVAAIPIVYFDTAHKTKLFERIENIEMSGRRPNDPSHAAAEGHGDRMF